MKEHSETLVYFSFILQTMDQDNYRYMYYILNQSEASFGYIKYRRKNVYCINVLTLLSLLIKIAGIVFRNILR